MMLKVGKRIKYLRSRQNLTVKDLALATGLSPSFISQVERGITLPSFNSLKNIARGLNTKLAHLFEENEREGITFIKSSKPNNLFNKDEGIFSRSLASSALSVYMRSQLLVLEAGRELPQEIIYSQGEKFCMLLKGKAELVRGEEKMIFEQGDSIHCVEDHKLKKIINIGNIPAELLWISFRQ